MKAMKASSPRRLARLPKYLLVSTLLAVAPLAWGQKQAPAPAAPQAGVLSGKVTETMNAASYTYVQIDTGPKKVWVAAPIFKVKAGDAVTAGNSMPMEKYHSKTLNRTFDVVYFTGNVTVNGKSTTPEAAGLPKGHPPIAGDSGKPAVDFSGLKKAADGKTIAEIYAGRAGLKGKEIKVRAKVVKYNAEIMGRNWLHIQDGTGAPGSNDLTVTTKATAKVGDTVLVTGKVATDRNFGGGYQYSLIIEDAKVTVE